MYYIPGDSRVSWNHGFLYDVSINNLLIKRKLRIIEIITKVIENVLKIVSNKT